MFSNLAITTNCIRMMDIASCILSNNQQGASHLYNAIEGSFAF